MGVTIQGESHTVEFPLILEMEWDPRVLEFYDQPAPIKLLYPRKDGRQLGLLHTPDFFVIRDDGLGWIECKSEQDLSKLAIKMPSRFVKEDSLWRCPPGERYASQYGFSYRVKSSAEFNETYLRNLVFLEEYLRIDFLPDDSAWETMDRVIAQPGISLAELLQSSDGNGADHIYSAIALGDLYVDIHQVLLAEPERVQVFPNLSVSRTHSSSTIHASPRIDTPRIISLVPGSTVIWDERPWTIANVGAKAVSLLSEHAGLVELPVPQFEVLVKEGKLTGLASDASLQRPGKLQDYLSRASPEDLQHANHRYEAIEPLLSGRRRSKDASRTERYWLKKYRDALEVHGSGFVGLLSHRCNSGNLRRKLPDGTLTLIDQFIEKYYENPKQIRKLAVWGLLLKECEARAIMPPSYKTFVKAVNQRAGFAQTSKRMGRRAAYQKVPFIWHLGLNTPRHGDRPWEVVHVDHTELDVELVCSRTGQNLGRPWLTLLVDAYSRRMLAFYLAFDPPSYRSVLMILRECVIRHARLPQTIVVDNGAEFHSVYFETFLARYEIVKKNRPPAQARFGSVCERLFGTTNTRFIHTLSGNTQIMRNVRQVTKSINPKSLACWTFSELYERVFDWVYEVYDNLEHPSLGQTPRDAYCAAMEKSGMRAHRLIPYDEDFKIFTLPTTPNGTAKVVPGHGIKIHYLFYWSDAFRDPQIEKTRVRVRYDPFDAGVAYAYVKNRWVRCLSQYYSYLQGRSEKEIKIATAELSKNSTRFGQQLKITARRLADFLASGEEKEVLLRQRLKDAEIKKALNLAPPVSLAPKSSTKPQQGDDGMDSQDTKLSAELDDHSNLEEYGEF